MPALPGKSSRRKYSTPRPKLDGDDVWNRTFKTMGLEPLSSDKDKPTTMATASDISSPTPEPSLVQGSENKKLTILDLPSETQKDIFKYVSLDCAHATVLAIELWELTMTLPVQQHRSHCPLPCIETLQRHCCGTVISKLSHCLPRRRRPIKRITHRWFGRRFGYLCHERLQLCSTLERDHTGAAEWRR